MKATLKLEDGDEIEVEITHEQIDSMRVYSEDTPKIGEMYWATTGDYVFSHIWLNDINDLARYEIGNVFKTEEEGEQKLERIKAEATLIRAIKKYNDGWEPDFNDNCTKYHICYGEQAIRVAFHSGGQVLPKEFYIKDIQGAEQIIEKYKREIRLYLRVGLCK